MANIKTMIEKEVAKGNTFISKTGDFISPERIDYYCKKSYVQALKDGSISFETTYTDYLNNEIESCYIPASVIESSFSSLFGFIDPDMNEPENAETVAM